MCAGRCREPRRKGTRVAAPSGCVVPWAARASCWPQPQQLLPVSAAGSGRRCCTGAFPRRTIRRVLRVALAAFSAAPWQGFEKAERCPSLASLFPPQAAVGSAAVRIHPCSPFCKTDKTETPVPGSDTGVLGGRGWIRTTEAESSRFTVCPHWPLGNTPIFFCVSCRTTCLF